MWQNSTRPRRNNKKIRKSVIEEIKEKHEEYKYYVIVDNDFSE